jgi:hypothetical protein
VTLELTAVGAAHEAIAQFSGKEDSQRLVASKCRALLLGYHSRWGLPDFDILAVEQLAQSDLYNPATQAKSRTFSVAGKIDLIVNRFGRRVLFDHKTTSEDIKDPNSTYWRQLVVEAQPSHYMLLEWLNGRKVDEATWDVMRKPDIRPKQVAKKDREETLRYGHYFGVKLSADSLEELRITERESLEMYECRLLHDCTKERPEHYFQRRTVMRLDAEIHEHATEIWDYSQEIILARRLARHSKNSGACIYYSRPCKYLGICSGHDEATSNNWKAKEQVHDELILIGTDGRDVLTNSRLTEFKTCRRKHFYSFEMGIDRIEEEEAEVLYFGSLWHKALEAYFVTIQKGQNGNNNDGPAGSELATTGTATNAEI